jgi:hypothetical protein
VGSKIEGEESGREVKNENSGGRSLNSRSPEIQPGKLKRSFHHKAAFICFFNAHSLDIVPDLS